MQKLLLRMRSAHAMTCAIILTALLISPLSLSLQISSFSLSLDIDGSAGDQGVTSLAVSSDQDVFIQIFGRDIQNARGLATRFAYDTTQVVYEGFDAGRVLPNVQTLSEQDSTTVLQHDGTSFVEIGMASLDGSAIVNTGLIGTLRFRTTDAFSDTEIRLVRAELGRGEQSETVTMALSVTLQVAAALLPDFDGSGVVDFPDFLAFVGAFGSQEGQEKYDTKYDLDSNDEIAFDDFLIFVSSFGKAVNRVPGFIFAPPVILSVDENTPAGQPIGDPISATDADGNTLTYSLSGADADYFAIDASTGQIQTKEGITYDYEAKKSYQVTIHVSDGEGGKVSLVVAININDINEPHATKSVAVTSDVISVCDRTPQVRDAIVAAVSGVSACGDVTADHLAAITRLGIVSRGISTLKAGDFSGLIALERLALNSNQLTTLEAGVFSGLPALEMLLLWGNQFSTLKAGIFFRSVRTEDSFFSSKPIQYVGG